MRAVGPQALVQRAAVIAREASAPRLREEIRAVTRRTSRQGLARATAALNPVLRGWFGTFEPATTGLDDAEPFTRRRLRAMSC